MRTPSGPFLKRHELIAILVFAIAAVTVGSLQLIY
jgi:hypothetical protein